MTAESVASTAAFQEGVGLDLAGRAWPVARPFAKRKESARLFVSGLSFDELRQFGASLLDKGLVVLPHQALQRDLFGAVALVVNGGAIRRLLELLANGLQARLSRW